MRARIARVWGAAFVSLVAVLLGLMVGAIIVALSGGDVVGALGAMLRGSVGSPPAIEESLRQATPLLIAGLGVAFAMRAGLFNIGAEGQLYIGAALGVLVGLGIPAAGPVLVVAAGLLGGALWGGAAGAMKARLGMNEVITTLLMNFIAFWFVSYLVHGPLRDRAGGGYPWTERLDPSSRIGGFAVDGLDVPGGFVLGLALAALVGLVLTRSHFGFEIRLLGASHTAARFAGVPVGRRTVQAMGFGGGLAGIAGAVELAAYQYRLSDFFSPGYGYTAIAVALVGNNTASGCVAAALLFGVLRAGSASMERTAGVPAAVSLVVQGVIVAFLVAARSPAVAAWVGRIRAGRLARASVPA
jgi:simple sugar transport system permease protein